MRLSDGLRQARQGRGLRADRILVVLLALPVHLVTIGLIALAGWLLLGDHGWGKSEAVLPLLGAVAVRPRLPPRAKPGLLAPGAFPETASLIREVARAVGIRPPTSVTIGVGFSASAGRAGLRGRSVTLGAPLWVALGPQARVAVLGHELGHLANGDLRSGGWVGSATHALDVWLEVMGPARGHSAQAHAMSQVTSTLLWPVRAILTGYQWLIDRAAAASTRRQETYADLVSVPAAGSAGAVDALEVTLVADGIDVTLNRAAITRRDPHAELTAYLANYGVAGRAGARCRAAREKSRADSTHPLTVERIDLIESVGYVAAAVVMDTGRNARIDGELRELLDRQLENHSFRYRGH